MKSLPRWPWLLLAMMLVAACSKEPEPAAPAPVPAPIAPVAAPPPVEPVASPTVPPRPASTAIPAGTNSATGFHGFGPARFGDDAEAVRIAWGRPLVADRDSTPDTPCIQLYPNPRSGDGFGIAFMLESDRFVRYDIDSADYEAPGGGRVGQSIADVRAAYAGRVQEAPHKYIEGGLMLNVPGPDASSKLVFEINAAGQVRSWRIGVPPPVDYVEGCG